MASFEDQLGKSLRGFPGAFVYHSPDDALSRAYKPADWLVCYASKFYAVEAKQTRTNTWNFAAWTPQQRAYAQQITAAGGTYWLVCGWVGPIGTPVTKWRAAALRAELLLSRLERGAKSVRFEEMAEWGRSVAWVPARGYDVGSLLP